MYLRQIYHLLQITPKMTRKMKAVSFNYTQYGLKRNRDKFQVLDVLKNWSFLAREVEL